MLKMQRLYKLVLYLEYTGIKEFIINNYIKARKKTNFHIYLSPFTYCATIKH